MNRLFQLLLIAMVTGMASASIAEKGTQELLRENETRNFSVQLEMAQSQLSLQQIEAGTAGRPAGINHLSAETDQLEVWNEPQAAADRMQEIAEHAELVATAQGAIANKAEDAAEELRDLMEQSEVRTKNNIYLVVMLIAVVGFITYIFRQSKKEPILQQHQKFGIAIIIGSALLILLAVVISEDWIHHFDFLQNLMSSLRIRLLDDGDRYNTYHIDIPTKYVVLTGIFAAAYGLTTYIGITPAPKKKQQPSQNASDEVAP